LLAAATAAFLTLRTGLDLPTGDGPAGPQTASKPAPAQRPAAAEEALRPTFDVVRAEPTGELVMAGRAEPGWTVTVETNGKVLGSSVADPNGEWFIQPDRPVAKGEHSLQLKSQAPSNGKTTFSRQRLALSLGNDAARSRPLVALTEEGQATRVLQMAPAPDDKRLGAVGAGAAATANFQTPPFKPAPTAEEAAAQVSFTSVDYEQAGGRNTVFLTGRGTPGARVMLYVDEQFAGTATIDATGAWTFKASRELGGGTHVLRADSVELKDGKVLARAEVNFDRQGHQAAAMEALGAASQANAAAADRVAAAAGQGGAGGDRRSAAVQVADDDLAGSGGAPGAGANPEGVIVVRRGDTLWHIAQQRYGNGARYTEIFQSNKGQIRNPNRIYPSQRFAVPR
jgi:hypothetical protein